MEDEKRKLNERSRKKILEFGIIGLIKTIAI